MKIKDAMVDESISYRDFFSVLADHDDIGCWDDINSSDAIYDYINDMMRDEVIVSHILKAMEEGNWCETEDWKMDLGCSLNTPVPISNKEELVEALQLSDEELELEFDFKTEGDEKW